MTQIFSNKMKLLCSLVRTRLGMTNEDVRRDIALGGKF